MWPALALWAVAAVVVPTCEALQGAASLCTRYIHLFVIVRKFIFVPHGDIPVLWEILGYRWVEVGIDCVEGVGV